MPSVTLAYAAVADKTFTALKVKGFDPADMLLLHPGIQHKGLDGSYSVTHKSFNRRITIELGVLTSYSDRLWVGNFINDTTDTRTVTYIHDSITETDLAVTLAKPEEFESEWLDGAEYRYVTLELIEKTTRTSFPA